jgi:hypothetical protein
MQYTFQINFIGKLQADSPEQAKELIKNEISKLTPEDYCQATDFYYINENGYQREWLSKSNEKV